MSKPMIRLDSAGMEEMLKSAPVAEAVHAAAEAIAAEVRTHPSMVRHELTDEVEVTDYVTDRAASAVTVTHPAGVGMQAKHGILSRAAGRTAGGNSG